LKKTFLALLLFVTALFAQTPIYELNSYVEDKAGVLEDKQIETLKSRLQSIEREDSTQIVILTLPNLEGYTIEGYAIDVAQKNKIGQKGVDNGVLIVADMGGREVRIEVGYGLEGVLTDAKASSIIRNSIVPEFKKGDFFAGFSKAVDDISRLQKKENFSSMTKAVIEEQNSLSVWLYTLLLPLGLFISYISTKAFRVYRLPSFSSLIFYFIGFALFTGFITFLQSSNVDDTIVLTFVITLFSIPLFVYLLPAIFLALSGEKGKLIFAYQLLKYKNRDSKIKEAIKAIKKSDYELRQYKSYRRIVKIKDSFEGFSYSILPHPSKSAECKDKSSYIIDLSDGEERFYHSLTLCYKDEKQKPKLILSKFKQSSSGVEELSSKEFDNFKALNSEVATLAGLYALISAISFAAYKNGGRSGFGSGGSRSSGGFSGGGGGFGGGGASGRW
jgi:uncharacterized protein